ncbi:MAG: HAD-IA family hydrolase [bacterium]|nr:HAD-IA family hydrolase [bacterium]
MNNIQFIYFDVGGVLVDYSNVFKTASSKFNLKITDIYAVFNENLEQVTKGFLSSQQLWEKCIQKYNIENAHDYNFVKSWVADYRSIKEMHDFINKNKSQYKIGLLSNIYEGMLPLLLEKKLIPNIQYDQIVFSCDVGMMKLNIDIYALAQKRAKVDSKNILLVDDREDFIAGAKKAGWNTFLFNNKQRENSAKELEEYVKIFEAK